MEPIDLHTWFLTADANTKDTMYYKKAFQNQCMFFRDTLAPVISVGMQKTEQNPYPKIKPMVISTHRSKSIELPVVQMSRPDIGLSFIIRDNFHDWKLSVVSDKPIDVDLSGIAYLNPPIDPQSTNYLSPHYFEGFPEHLIFGHYGASDKKKFSLDLGEENLVYMTVFLIMRSVGAIKPLVQRVSKEFAAAHPEIKAETW